MANRKHIIRQEVKNFNPIIDKYRYHDETGPLSSGQIVLSQDSLRYISENRLRPSIHLFGELGGEEGLGMSLRTFRHILTRVRPLSTDEISQQCLIAKTK